MSGGLALDQAGRQFSVTRECIRRIVAKALRKLEHPVVVKKAAEFPG